MQKILANPQALRIFLDREIEELDRLVDRAMKKKPQSVHGDRDRDLAAIAGR